MGEKGGGKGFTIPPTSMKGKDDASAKSKRGRKPRVSFEESLDDMASNTSKSAGKGDNPATKANWGKDGKGASMNGGTAKASVPKVPPKLELRVENELPKNTKCLMDCEAALILEGIQDQMVMLSEDPTIKIPLSFDKGLKYAKTGDLYSDVPSVRRHLETLKKHGVSEGEICMIANICAGTADEVFALIPSLKPKRGTLREPINNVLMELAKVKHSTESPDIY